MVFTVRKDEFTISVALRTGPIAGNCFCREKGWADNESSDADLPEVGY